MGLFLCSNTLGFHLKKGSVASSQKYLYHRPVFYEIFWSDVDAEVRPLPACVQETEPEQRQVTKYGGGGLNRQAIPKHLRTFDDGFSVPT